MDGKGDQGERARVQKSWLTFMSCTSFRCRVSLCSTFTPPWRCGAVRRTRGCAGPKRGSNSECMHHRSHEGSSSSPRIPTPLFLPPISALSVRVNPSGSNTAVLLPIPPPPPPSGRWRWRRSSPAFSRQVLKFASPCLSLPSPSPQHLLFADHATRLLRLCISHPARSPPPPTLGHAIPGQHFSATSKQFLGTAATSFEVTHARTHKHTTTP